ncbi:Myo-inositol catabolism IolB domain protein OS=Tsukamurella paurometabola (strain ATCC 8368 / DSM / CCUG 35730 / CIP 100753 / JCM 10117 / KCTC 9821 / NBRC 16120 / NCIMB 702349 / NCTC 13040) OX=521096 GN=Tpau_1368 PE=4 SV=1 [Tsukamurella paurometabola]|uniref:Myo-inositol catabolism IolB domain protein n=1 Tax=Tsukamurella paurometabola (strain ATCC 8368 / DSM 20162 / CCUG 35730 / CIP 100753 / JCM 10117 / KCTC 9821 / NBRC 16120 / NCIMB 702349 / NCTC 13040) TaxID=521096 RepID=D5UWX4_TSUPD|nr:5-deoxy-glucuronate isomerase [Tsukamurella paurometabola]ADG77996.1 Myo-inositol catabolism IolB domain protein [Tsukamurella paurometabola DSM 20162]SUP29709.1 5-deoxy-glucuronate isomerase [Tsukamurella paurometabola]
MAATPNEWFYRRGDLARHGWESVVDTTIPRWRHTGIRIADLGGRALVLPGDGTERIVIPLAGSCVVDHEGGSTTLAGRHSVFDGPTDVLYTGAGTGVTVRGAGRVAVAEAPASIHLPTRHIRAEDVPVEVRGAGRDTRQVHNFGTPATLDAAALIVCEVITPAGNWSSHPAHKHDEYVAGHETRLEEIYYFEAAPARSLRSSGVVPADADPFGNFVTYSSNAGDIDTNAMVRSGDIALVPFGYHGPAMAAPEYDLYYLNVMAGPDPDRAWLISDDPRQAWLRETWASRAPDARLPYTTAAPTEGGQV